MRRASGGTGAVLESWVAARALADASRTLVQLRLVRGASRRTQRRMTRAAAMMVAAAGLLGSAPARAAVPQFIPPQTLSADLGNVGSLPQPVMADIDGDGDLDAFVGNLLGDVVFLENTGTSAVPAFAASSANPFGLADVGFYSSPTFADIDGDGDLDAFIGNYNGDTAFFANTGTSAAPAFAASSANPFGLVNVVLRSSPSFADIDGDGDLDAFIGNYNGGTAFFQNTGTPAAAAFAASSANPFGLTDVGNISSPTFADVDGDGDLDAFVGEQLGDTVFFANTGTSAAPAFAASSVNPFGLTNVGGFSSPSFADIDDDGDLDAFIGELTGVAFLANSGSSTAPAFGTLPANPFGLSDVGAYSSPAFADIDGDGDLDAFIGEQSGNTVFFANTGTSAAPAFAASSANPFGLADVGFFSSPAFADIDGDGDLDAFIGEQSGNTVFFANTGTSAVPAFAAASSNPFGLANVAFYSSPTFADIDGDGDLDAFIGEQFGNTVFFANTGTSAAAAFAASSANPFGLTDVGNTSSPTFADGDGDGDLDAFVGRVQPGNTVFFENSGNSAAPAFAASSANPFGLVDVGDYSSPTFADIDGDGDLDAFIGEFYGATFFFENLQAVFTCPTTPGTCQEGFAKALLVVKEKTPGKEKLIAKLVQGPALTQADFGNPLGAEGTAYRLCIYGDDDALVASLAVDRAGDICAGAACWKSIGAAPPSGKGFQYKDKDAAADGVKILKLKGGDAGKSLLLLKAANNVGQGQTALPIGIAAALAGATSATVQLHANDVPCFSADLETVNTADVDFFKAKN